MTTLFAFFEIALGPTKFVSMRNDEKFCSIRMQPTSKNTTTESLTTKLLYTRRDRSRRIRDEATACEPEVEIWRRPDF